MGRGLRVIAAVLCLGTGVPAVVHAEAILTFAPASIDFDSVAVGQTVSDAVLLKNTGNTSTTITDVFPVSGTTALTASPTSFTLAPDQTQVVTFTFLPIRAGNLADAFKIVANATVFGSTAPVINIPVSGTATGPRITVSRPRLSFQSSKVGTPVSQKVILGNAGTEGLNVLSLLTTSSAFVSAPSAGFTIAAGDTQSVTVTYTPTTTQALSDTLTVLSDSPSDNLTYIGLDALETPTQPKTARLSLLRTDGTQTPSVGDSIRVAVFMIPNADTIRGVEAFLGYHADVLKPINSTTKPFRRANLTQTPGFQINKVETLSTTQVSAHLSVFFNSNKRAADTLAVIVFEVLQQIGPETTVRVLTEKPLRNSNFLTPNNLSFAIPGSTKVSLENRAPVIQPFGIFEFNEDTDLLVDLRTRAEDVETPDDRLMWTFVDANNVFTIQVEPSDTAQTLRLTPPENGFGVFDVLAIVTDEGGASDSSAVILDVRATNDPPNVPAYIAPADSTEGLESPVTLSWTGDDPEGDEVSFEVRVGTTQAGLQPIATGVQSPYLAQGLGPATTYFWQIVSIDGAGARTEGAIRRFVTGPDEKAPQFLSQPRDTLATSTSVLIQWDTDETSTSVVRIGLSPVLADSANFETAGSDVFLVLRHQVPITGLTPDQTYFFQATSRDLFGNTSVSPIASFTTLEPAFILGDFDDNRTIDFGDFLLFAQSYNTSLGDTAYNALGDFDGDDTIDFTDFLSFAAVFGTTP